MHDFASINRALALRIPDLAAALGLGAATSRTATGWRFGKRGSLAVRIDGRWFCHETANHGDMVGLVHSRLNLASMVEAARWAESFLGGTWRSDPLPQEIQRPAVADDAERIRRALAIWEQSVALGGTLGERYLESRGVGFASIAAESSSVRFHPRCPWGRATVPAMVSLMTGALTGEPSGIHRTALDPSGRKLERRMMGRAGIVQITDPADCGAGLGICEGLETGLSILRSGWSPIWACLSAGGIARFPMLPFTQSLTIFADHDDAGLSAASACSDRWRAAGREARVVVPPREGDDWADDFLRRADHG